MTPRSCWPNTTLPMRIGVRGKGLGNGWMTYEYIHPARLFRITRRPMHTMTSVRTGFPSIGRMTIRSMRKPPAKARTTVAKNATQYGAPALSIDHAR